MCSSCLVRDVFVCESLNYDDIMVVGMGMMGGGDGEGDGGGGGDDGGW